MVKNKKTNQKTLEFPAETEDDPLTEPANASSPCSTSPEHAQSDEPEEDTSVSPILGAIRRMENLETTLAGVKNAVASNTSRIVNLEEWHGEFDGRLAELEKSCDA